MLLALPPSILFTVPGGPTGPVGPVGPISPVEPSGPVGPVSPIVPSTNTKLLLLATNNAGLMTDSSGLNVTVDNINGLTWSSDNPF